MQLQRQMEIERQREEEIEREREEKRRQELEKQREEEEKRMKEKQERAKMQLPEEPEDGSPSVINIAFKLPSGERIKRRFLDTSKVSTLFTFVDASQSELPPDSYELISSFPRSTLDDPEKTILDYGLTKSALLLVQQI